VEIVGKITVVALTALLRGYVLSVLWQWFVVRTFHAPPLAIPVALGISTLFGYLNADMKPQPKDDRSSALLATIAVVQALVALGLGWVFYYFSGV